jgi:hypothetical protein
VTFSLFHQIPIWLDFVIFARVILVGFAIGLQVGLRRHHAEGDTGQLILASLFGVPGLMLAFTFGSGLNQHEARKRALVAEANVLGTAHLRAGLVSEPYRSEWREALLNYGRSRKTSF